MKKVILLMLMVCSFIACQSQAPKEKTSTTQQTEMQDPYQDISVAEFKSKIGGDNVVVIDVRTPPEIAEGKIEGSMEIDFRASDFESKIDELDKEKTYLIYCRSGGRSGNTCKMMAEKGFKQLYNLEGGYTEWIKEN